MAEITWEDAHSSSANVWQNAEEFDAEATHTAVCKSVGYIWSEDKDKIVLVASMHIEGTEEQVHQVSGTIAIPAGMIRKRRILR